MLADCERIDHLGLNRDVAVKILPDQFAKDPERLARLTREAQTLAALNHSNIGGTYRLEEADGIRCPYREFGTPCYINGFGLISSISHARHPDRRARRPVCTLTTITTGALRTTIPGAFEPPKNANTGRSSGAHMSTGFTTITNATPRRLTGASGRRTDRNRAVFDGGDILGTGTKSAWVRNASRGI